MASRNLNMKTKEAPSEPLYYAYGADGPSSEVSAACLNEVGVVDSAFAMNRWEGLGGGNISVREGMSRRDYEIFRPAERTPRHQREIIATCDETYRRVGLIKNIINAMSEFTCQGIQIFHPAASKQKRYRHWFRKVGGIERSERFANLLFRHGAVIVKRWYADLNIGDIGDLEEGVAAIKSPADMKYERSITVYKNRIPLRYTFLNPTAVDVVGGDLAMFAGKQMYKLRLPQALITIIKNPRNEADRMIVANLPPGIVSDVRNGKKEILLDPEKISVFHYKKDDWQQWSDPLIYSILTDIRLYDKMKLADAAALDGSISRIRLWKLGLPEHRIQAGPGAFKRLREQLLANTGGGSFDLIWDAALDLQETSTDVYQFLGSQKYEPVLQAMYAGLGIPQAMTGQEGGGMVNTAMGLRTLIERLQYARDILTEFWDREFYILQKAFGDRQPAQVKFDNLSLSDEATEKKLWIDLCDRDIISVTTLQERWGQIPEVETMRLRTEHQMREEEKLPVKAGPYSPVGPEYQLRQVALTQGTISPTEAGVKKKPKKAGDKSVLDIQQETENKRLAMEKKQLDQQAKQGEDLHQQKLAQNDEAHQQKLAQKDTEHKAMLPIKKQAAKKKLSQTKPTGQSGEGRPKGQKDAVKRKQRTPKATGSTFDMITTQMWARGAQKVIADVITPLYLERCNKKNKRLLTTVEANDLEDRKFDMLCALLPHTPITVGVLANMWEAPPAESKGAREHLNRLINTMPTDPTADEMRELQASAYAIYISEGDTDA